ncbi:hypothetical protein CIN_20130 [Commensalibacter intestini A911]|uniref:Uncharacterized protein n=1 Tax=Commensalibacter intestini A911 TaxID=1088868 RepID=G6F317_9PROT|nr:hypothetical protein [Commensalibacter intestini]EHD13030.1 hypothetical protein CIN_20130 [Commensalibacter intestini A911]
MAITITGANGDTVSVGAATGRARAPAAALQSEINSGIADGSIVAYDIYPSSGNPDNTTNAKEAAIVQESGTYAVPNTYRYIVVADDDGTNSGAVTLNSPDFLLGTVSILAGRTSGTTYNAGNEAGTLINTVGNLTFDGSGKTGAWTIYTGDGESTVTTTNANNKINTGTGKTSIALGSGNNTIYSQGQDTITGGAGGYNTVTLTGAKSQVTMDDNTLILDTGTTNAISVGKNSTVTGGSSGTVTFANGGTQNIYQGGSGETVSATTSGTELKVIHGADTSYDINGKINFLNGTGTTTLTATDQLTAFGASDSNYTMNASGSNTGLFVADKGNETLNASGSTIGIQIYANTVSGATANFVATGGSGNDTLAAGIGNTTFTGGAGDNLFMFTKGATGNGNTVITDFGTSGNNKIGLFNYGLDESSLATLLQNSKNDASGNAVLSLDDSQTVTLQGVSVSDLNASRFEVLNATAKTA